MHRAMHQLAVKPVFNPSRVLVLIIDGAFFLFKQRIVHVAFGGGNNQFELLISAADVVDAGIVTVKLVDVLSDPKSKTATDRLALELL